MLYPAREARKKTETKAQLSRRLQLDRFYYKRACRDLFGSSIESIHSIKRVIQEIYIPSDGAYYFRSQGFFLLSPFLF